MPVKKPMLVPPSNASEDAVMALIEKGGSVPQASPAPPAKPKAAPVTPPAVPKKAAPMSSAPAVGYAGAKRGPKAGTSRAARSAEEATHRHTLYMPDDLYQALVQLQERQRRPWPSLNTLILQALYDLVERAE